LSFENLIADICTAIIFLIPEFGIRFRQCGIPEGNVFVSITVEHIDLDMGGFDFLINFNWSQISLASATFGQLPTDCVWEYLSYRFLETGIEISAIAETNNGPYYPSCFGPPDTDPHELVEMTFSVADIVANECAYVPIRFFWDDCNDNAVASVTGETLYVSDHVYDFEGTEITDSTYGFPTYFGIQEGCPGSGDPEDPTRISQFDFYSGGIATYLFGDADNNEAINILDVTYLISYLYKGGPAPVCPNSGDPNGDCATNILDVTYLINYLYKGGPAPKPGCVD